MPTSSRQPSTRRTRVAAKTGEIFFDAPTELRRGGIFRLLWAAHMPALRNWNHAHVFDPFWRVYYNVQPGNFIEHEGRRIPFGPSVFVLVPANVLFKTFSGPAPRDHLFVHFMVDAGLFCKLTSPVVLPATRTGKDLVRELRESLACDSAKSRSRHLGLAWLHHLFSRLVAGEDTLGPQRPEIARVLKALQDNVHALPHLAEMARYAGMSRRNFHRSFEKTVGKSPAQYVREVRLREAARQLVKTSRSIDAIAADLGFANRFHFSRLFRRFIGTPPAAFRREGEKRSGLVNAIQIDPKTDPKKLDFGFTS